eukprot:42026-Eustigmatos_ZCMA.PRE.1
MGPYSATLQRRRTYSARGTRRTGAPHPVSVNDGHIGGKSVIRQLRSHLPPQHASLSTPPHAYQLLACETGDHQQMYRHGQTHSGG